MDKNVINSGENILTMEAQHYHSGWKLMLVERSPLKNENLKNSGLLIHYTDLSNTSFFNFYSALFQLDNKIRGQKYQPASYMLSNPCKFLPLTEKQENCLFLLIRGKTTKEIAKTLKLSPRTIETHIEAIKNRLNCDTKSAIIEIAIDSGFLFYIPKYFQKTVHT